MLPRYGGGQHVLRRNRLVAWPSRIVLMFIDVLSNSLRGCRRTIDINPRDGSQ